MAIMDSTLNVSICKAIFLELIKSFMYFSRHNIIMLMET